MVGREGIRGKLTALRTRHNLCLDIWGCLSRIDLQDLDEAGDMGLFNVNTLDVLTMGRIGVDIYPLQTGVGLQDVRDFGKFLGGSPTNVAVAAARLGSSSGIVSAVGKDPFGAFCRGELGRLGVFEDYVQVMPGHNTPVTFCEIFPPDHFPLYFYRRPVAPDMLLTADTLPHTAIRDARMFWVTGTGFSDEPSRGAHFAALEARAGGGHTALDLDYREQFWPDANDARRWMQEALRKVTIAVGNREECQVAVGEDDPIAAGKELLKLGVEIAVVKDGPRGATLMTADEAFHVPGTRVDVLNGLGSGDAFGGALCHGLVQGWELNELLGVASAAGAIVASRLECSTAMPTLPELRRMLRRRPQPVTRICHDDDPASKTRSEESND